MFLRYVACMPQQHCRFIQLQNSTLYPRLQQFPTATNVLCSGIVGLVNGFGKYLIKENITLNAICPHVVRTSMSPDHFYDKVEEEGLMTPISMVMEAFKSILGSSQISGACLEVGPNGFAIMSAPDYWNEESKRSTDLISKNGEKWHELIKD